MRYFDINQPNSKKNRELYGTATLLLFILPLITTVILLSLIYCSDSKDFANISIYPYYVFIIIISALSAIQKLALGLLRIKNEVWKFNIFNIAFFGLQILLSIYFVVALKQKLVGHLYATLIANLSFFILSALFLIKYSTFQLKISYVKKLLFFGIPLVPFFIFGWVQSYSHRFFVEKYFSLSDLGEFAVAFQFAGIITIAVNAFENAFLPFYYKEAKKKNSSHELGKLITNIFSIIFLIILFTLIFLKPVIIIIVDSSFHSATKYIPFLLLSNALFAVYKIFQVNILFAEKTHLLSSHKILGSILTVSSLYLFIVILKFGTLGIAYSMILVNFLTLLPSFYHSQKHNYIIYENKKLIVLVLIFSAGWYIFTNITFSNNLYISLIIQIMVLFLLSFSFYSFTLKGNFKLMNSTFKETK